MEPVSSLHPAHEQTHINTENLYIFLHLLNIYKHCEMSLSFLAFRKYFRMISPAIHNIVE